MKNDTQNRKQQQKGYSLIELSVALSIAAVVIVAGLVGARQVLLSNSINSQIRESNQTIFKLRKALARQADTSELTGSNAGLLGVWPNDRSSCTTATPAVCTNRSVFNQAFEHAFNNTESIGNNLPNNSGVMYVLWHVPNQTCTDLVNGLDASAYALYAGASTATAPITGTVPAGFATVKAPDTNTVSVAALATGCANSSGYSDIYAAIQL
jgi:prepilin-type N-terminal cleavage/methylation domain-containing protein